MTSGVSPITVQVIATARRRLTWWTRTPGQEFRNDLEMWDAAKIDDLSKDFRESASAKIYQSGTDALVERLQDNSSSLSDEDLVGIVLNLRLFEINHDTSVLYGLTARAPCPRHLAARMVLDEILTRCGDFPVDIRLPVIHGALIALKRFGGPYPLDLFKKILPLVDERGDYLISYVTSAKSADRYLRFGVAGEAACMFDMANGKLQERDHKAAKALHRSHLEYLLDFATIKALFPRREMTPYRFLYGVVRGAKLPMENKLHLFKIACMTTPDSEEYRRFFRKIINKFPLEYRKVAEQALRQASKSPVARG